MLLVWIVDWKRFLHSDGLVCRCIVLEYYCKCSKKSYLCSFGPVVSCCKLVTFRKLLCIHFCSKLDNPCSGVAYLEYKLLNHQKITLQEKVQPFSTLRCFSNIQKVKNNWIIKFYNWSSTLGSLGWQKMTLTLAIANSLHLEFKTVFRLGFCNLK